jgi:serine phosphatase RsbU (regulator of sigma subunit)
MRRDPIDLSARKRLDSPPFPPSLLAETGSKWDEEDASESDLAIPALSLAPFTTDSITLEDTEPISDRLYYLEALAAASNAINGTLEPDEVSELLLAKAIELLHVSAASVMLLDERNVVQSVAAKGLSANYRAVQDGPLEKSIAARALAEGRTFASWDLRKSQDATLAKVAAEEGIVSVACAPMFFGTRAVGALNIYCREERCFTQDQFYVLSLLASHGAVALSNARAHRQLRVQAADVRASFQRVGAALTASLDLGDTLRLIVQLAVEMTHANGGAMFMVQSEEEGGGLLLSSARGLDRRSIRRFRRLPVAGLAQQALDEKRVIVVADTRLRPDIAFPTLRDYDDDEPAETRSIVCVPVLAGNRPVGVLEQYAARPDAFENSDIELLSSFAHQASVAIENARLYAQERGIAQTLQRSFLPELPQAISGFQIGRIYAPGSEISSVGGDTYDLFTLPDGRIAVLIADVSGQGTAAATLAVMAKYTIRAYALEDPEPSSVVRRVNNALVHQTSDSTFLTLCYALIDPTTRTVTLARAAHPPPILCRVANPDECEALESTSGLIAGFLLNQEFDTQQVALQTGDILVFYTDGVIEARRRKVMFEQERLMQAVRENANESAQEIAGAIYAAVSDYTQGVLNDDIALLVLKAE